MVWALRCFNHTIHSAVRAAGSRLVYTQDASTGRLIVVERETEREGREKSHSSALCENFDVAYKA